MQRLLVVALGAVLSTAACKEAKKDPPKLRKMDFKVTVDERGRMLPELELYDQHHAPIAVAGSYTLTLSRPDNTVLCSVSRPLAKADFANNRFKTDWQDAACPPDPAAEELRVTLEVKTGDAPDDPKLARDKTTPTKFIYRHLKPPAPAGAGSAAGSGAGAAAAGSGSGATDAKMITPEKPATEGSAAGSAAPSGSGAAAGATSGSGAAAGAGSGAAAGVGSGAAK